MMERSVGHYIARWGLSVLGMVVATASHAQGTLRTGVDATFAPHAMTKLGGGLQGFNVELAEALSAQIGRPIQVDGVENSALVPGLLAKKYDFLVAPVIVTPERAKAMLFTEGYVDTRYAFLVKKSAAPITSLEDLKGKTLAVNKGSVYEQWSRDNNEKYGFKYDVYGTNADAVQAVESGRADANMSILTVAGWAAKQNPNVRVAFSIPTGLVTAVAFRPDDREGRALISNALKCLKQKGTVVKLAEKWFGYTPDADSASAKLVVGTGVPGLDGYEDALITPKC
jgi:polar amino acid transport system substrate-binding protein